MTALPAPVLMVGASLLFALMGVCVKLAAVQYTAGEIVMYRGLVGAVAVLALARWRGVSLRTTVPAMHLRRSASGVAALSLWFQAISGLPLATAVTLNYMSSVWMAVYLIVGALLWRGAGRGRRIDKPLLAAVAAGFVGVALVLRPTLDERQVFFALCGLLSGMLSALAYLQVSALGRAGEPETRIVFYFSLGGVVAGAAMASAGAGWHAHTARGVALLLATGVLATTAQLLMTRAYAIGRALGNAALQYLGIVFSFIFGVLLFSDPVHPGALAGMALIVAAGWVATARTRAGAAPPPAPAP